MQLSLRALPGAGALSCSICFEHRVDVADGEERRNLVFEYNIAEDTIYGVAEGATSVSAMPAAARYRSCLFYSSATRIDPSVAKLSRAVTTDTGTVLCSATPMGDGVTTGSAPWVKRGRLPRL